MAVVTVKSTAITQRDAKVMVDNHLVNQFVRELIGKCTVGAGDSVGSKLVFGTICSQARISEILISAPDIGATTALDIGLYDTTEAGGGVIDADFFASAVSVSGGAVNESVIHGESGVFTLANSEKRLWEALGLTKDPGKMYDIVGTLTGAADATGDIVLKAHFLV